MVQQTQGSDGVFTQLSAPSMERSFINALVTYPERWNLVDLAPQDLHDIRHQILLETILEMVKKNIAVDPETLVQTLTAQKLLEAAGGFIYIVSDIMAHSIGTGYPDDYVTMLSDLATRRAAFRMGQEFLRSVMDQEQGITETISRYSLTIPRLVKTREEVLSIGEWASRHYDHLQYMTDHPDEASRRILHTARTEPNGRSSLREFDAATGGGLRVSELMLVLGKPGLGKTKWIHKLGHNLALNGHPGVIFQLETSEDEVMDREFSRETGIPVERLETGALWEEEYPLYTHALEKMTDPDNKLFLVFGGSPNTVTLRAILTKLIAEQGIQWFGLDYLKFLSDTFGKDQTEREAYISIQLKKICRDLKLAGVVIHSMNKTGLAADAPEMEHGSGAADMAFDCDKMLFVNEHIPEEGEMRNANIRTGVFRKSRHKLARSRFNMVALPDRPDFLDPVGSEGGSGSARD